MKMLVNMLTIIGLLFIFNGSALAGNTWWNFQWKIDEMTNQSSCTVFSTSKIYRTGYGSSGHYTTSAVYIGIQHNGQFSLHSKKYPFDPQYLSKIGFRVDGNEPIFGPSLGSNNRTLLFPKAVSTKLQEQLLKGKEILVQVVFFPKGEAVRKQFSLEGFTVALSKYNGCKSLVESDGWVGIFAVDLGAEPKWVNWLKKHVGAVNPGVFIITLDPRKAGANSGLKEADAIVAFNGLPAAVATLFPAIKGMKSGEKMELKIVRGNTVIKKTITKP